MDKNSIKLGKIVQILKNNKFFNELNSDYIKKIIDSGFDINYKLSANSLICQIKPEYSGNTALHFAVELNCHSEFYNVLIECGADLTIQNDAGYTPLLLAFNKNYDFDPLLNAHFELKNSTNVKSQNGISHFHVACTTNLIEVANIFYKAGTPIDECVNNDSPKYPGFTPLHFAVQYRKLQTIKFLLSHGASLHSKDTHGVTPLHLAIKILMHESNVYFNTITFYQKMIRSNFLKLPDDVDLSHLHVGCVLGMDQLVDQVIKDDIDINSSVNFNSPIWPGYTALHFAAHINLQSVIMLLDRGADILAKDANGTTSFDLCVKKFNLKDIITILSAEKLHCLSELEFIDGIRLLDVLHVMTDDSQFEQFIERQVNDVNTFIPFTSPVWPGYKLLHFVAIFTINKTLTSDLLSYNADFKMLNADNMTPLHLAFRRQNISVIKAMLDAYREISSDCVDQDNLSHLHIACAMNNERVVELLLRGHSNPNLPTLIDFNWRFSEYNSNEIIKSRSTPLHIAIKTMNYNLINLLLLYEANPNLADTDGMTPFQVALNSEIVGLVGEAKQKHTQLLNQMLNTNMNVEIENDEFVNFNYLIHIALDKINFELFIVQKLVRILDQQQLYDKIGLTRLQVACGLSDYYMMKHELESGADVNRRIACDSPVWPGNTAFHIVVLKYSSLRKDMAKLLLQHGANPTIKNANNSTPVHLGGYKVLEITTKWLEWNNFSSVNPVDNEGLTHFHLCCMSKNLCVIEKFVKSRVDINCTVNHLGSFYDGYTPLHFAIEYSSKDVMKLLLKNGANPGIEAANGLTPLHLAATHQSDSCNRLVALLRCSGVNLQTTNAFGETILEKVFANENLNSNAIYFLFKKGAPLNILRIPTQRLNKFKFISHVLNKLFTYTFQHFKNNIPNLLDADNEGQNIIHYAILHFDSYDRLNNIKEIIQSGCEINHKDNKGKTALHKAVEKKSVEALEMLFSLGADINIKDDNGKTPFAYTLGEQFRLKIAFQKHVIHLEWLGLYVDPMNKSSDLDYKSLKIPNYANEEKSKLDRKLKEISSSFSDNYFFSERFVNNYKRLPVIQREKISDLCDTRRLCYQFPTLHPFISLQYRKALARARLYKPVVAIVYQFLPLALPEPCLESIFENFDISDIMNLIRAVNGKLVYESIL